MFGILLYDVLFFAIPAIFLVLWGVSIYRYRAAKIQNREAPGSIPPESLKRRKLAVILLSVIFGVFVLVVLGFMGLLFMAVAYM